MKKWQVSIFTVALVSSQVSWAGRMGDAWKGSQSRIHGRFSKGHGNGTAGGLFLLSSTTITSVSTTALTTGGDLLKQVAVRDEFIDQNLYAIKLDSAKGQGEYVQTLATLSGCKGAEAQALFSSKIRSNFRSVYDSSMGQDPAEIADHIDQLIEDDPEMRKSCDGGTTA